MVVEELGVERIAVELEFGRIAEEWEAEYIVGEALDMLAVVAVLVEEQSVVLVEEGSEEVLVCRNLGAEEPRLR